MSQLKKRVRIGPAGLGGKDEAIANLERYAKQEINSCEVSFTYSVYLDEESALEIGEKAKELDIVLSIHAPYFVNLNATEKEKIESSKKRILSCCRIAHCFSLAWKGKKKISVVFHPGYYSKMSSEQAGKNIIERIKEMQLEIKKNKWENVDLCPEVMGKVNVFGSIDEIENLVKETGCNCCVDFAHILARYQGNKMFPEIKSAFGKMTKIHCHFSGIIYGDKGEKKHKQTTKEEWKEILEFIDKNGLEAKEIVIVSEAPEPEKDAAMAVKML